MTTLLLTFRGLTAFVLEGQPFHVVLVDAAKTGHHKHSPALTFAAEEFVSFDRQTELATVAAVDGSMTGVWPLDGLVLKINSAPSTSGLNANGRHLIEDAPRSGKIHPDCLADDPRGRPVAARVDLTSGTVSAQEIHRRGRSVSHVSYRFTTADTDIVIEGRSMAVAGVVGKLTLRPWRDPVIKAAITNWPAVQLLQDDHKSAYDKLLNEESSLAGSSDDRHHAGHESAPRETARDRERRDGIGHGCDPMEFARA